MLRQPSRLRRRPSGFADRPRGRGALCVFQFFGGIDDGDSNLQTRAISDYYPTNSLLLPDFTRSASHCIAVSSSHSVVTLLQGCLPQRNQKRTGLKVHCGGLGRGEQVAVPGFAP
jgi:hypothetical protein